MAIRFRQFNSDPNLSAELMFGTKRPVVITPFMVFYAVVILYTMFVFLFMMATS